MLLLFKNPFFFFTQARFGRPNREPTLSSLRGCWTFKTVVSLHVAEATLSSLRARRTLSNLWWKCKFYASPKQPSRHFVPFSSLRARRTLKTVAKCKFYTCRSNLLVTSCSIGRSKLWWHVNLSVWPRNPFVTSWSHRTSKTLVKRWFLYAASCRRCRSLVLHIFAQAAVAKRTFRNIWLHAAVR